MPTVDLGLVVGSNGQGVPTGGSAGQILAKNSSSNYDTGWVPMSAAAAAAFGIVENGNAASHTIAAGQYVIWKGVLYTADAAIASGTTLAASGGNKNLTAVSGGGLNALQTSVDTLNSNLTIRDIKSTLSSSVATIDSALSQRIGSVVVVQIRFTLTSAVTPSTNIISGFDRSISNYGGVNTFRLYDSTTAGFIDAHVTHPDGAGSIESLRIFGNVESGHAIRGTFMYIAI